MPNPANESAHESECPGKHLSGVDPASYRSVLRRHPAGVAIITLSSASGPVGFTATSFTSVSLSPPLVSFNITNTSSSLSALCSAESVLIHLLGWQQKELANRFSNDAAMRFADNTQWSPIVSGEPLLRGTAHWLRVVLQQLIPAGDSTLVLGLVTHTHSEESAEESPSLIYRDGMYLRTNPFPD
jgi:flavin reductase (DIM6/NTAB) family NADH-FMN oxidoreductase RutF